jgi:hypothetical protein
MSEISDEAMAAIIETRQPELPYYLTAAFRDELWDLAKRINPHSEIPRLRLNGYAFAPEHWITSADGTSVMLVINTLEEFQRLAEYEGAAEVVDLLTTPGPGYPAADIPVMRDRREDLLDRLDVIQRGCAAEYSYEHTADERDALATLKSYCYNLMCDLGGR